MENLYNFFEQIQFKVFFFKIILIVVNTNYNISLKYINFYSIIFKIFALNSLNIYEKILTNIY